MKPSPLSIAHYKCRRPFGSSSWLVANECTQPIVLFYWHWNYIHVFAPQMELFSVAGSWSHRSVAPQRGNTRVHHWLNRAMLKKVWEKNEEEEKSQQKNHITMAGIRTHKLCFQSGALYPLDHSQIQINFISISRFNPSVSPLSFSFENL